LNRATTAILLLAGLALSAATIACSVDDSANPAPRCDDAGGCAAGLVCYRGFCIGGAGADCDMEGEVLRCYTGPADTDLVGNCRPGERECRGGVYTACIGEVLPGTEGADNVGRLCNGEDDDCDGMTDEFDAPDCDTGMDGVCATGRLTCAGGAGACVAQQEPTAEACNGEDDDCDGETDESSDMRCWPGTDGCTDNGDGSYSCMGVCSAGTQVCAGGTLGSCEGAVTASSDPDDCTPSGSTAADDDCDGMTDEDCACMIGATQACYGGPMGTSGTGICVSGTQTCAEVSPGTNRFGPCVGEVVPGTESCTNEGADDDCNGTDDDIPARGDACIDGAAMGVCRAGVVDCMGSSYTCVTEAPTTETCDGRDNDCDGTVDNGFDLLLDEMNCGMCGNVCGVGLECCAGTCVNVDTDAMHCGMCGTDCGMGVSCCGGTCADLAIDELHCGDCGTACSGVQRCCGGACTDPRIDAMNCGSCGTTCTAGDLCCLSACHAPGDLECAACLDDCAAMGLACCSASCVDTMTDSTNCGGCGVTCTMGQLCCGGSCVPNDETNCGSCGASCSGSDLCCGGSCVPSDAANCGACDTACGGGDDCCSSMCIDIREDDANCGSCGMACPGMEQCTNGRCCPTGETFCAGSCRDTQVDNRHCGACNDRCNGSETCVMGACVRL